MQRQAPYPRLKRGTLDVAKPRRLFFGPSRRATSEWRRRTRTSARKRSRRRGITRIDCGRCFRRRRRGGAYYGAQPGCRRALAARTSDSDSGGALTVVALDPAGSITTCPCPCRGSKCSTAVCSSWRSTTACSSWRSTTYRRPMNSTLRPTTSWDSIDLTTPSMTTTATTGSTDCWMGCSMGWMTTCSTSSVASFATWTCFGDRCTPRRTSPRRLRRTVRKPSFASPFVTNADRRREIPRADPRRVVTVPAARGGHHRFDPEGPVGSCRTLPHDLQLHADSDARGSNAAPQWHE